jgi:D-alanyl-D-alanine dipeptidase
MKNLVILFAFMLSLSVVGQNKYGLTPESYNDYKKSIAINPEKELVDLEKFIPGIVLDIRYATATNFTKKKVYGLAKAYARRPVAEALKQAQEEFNKMGLGIKIYDSYRPYSATVKFYELMKGDTTYVASPYHGSRHNRGCAVDMTIVNLKTGKELDMPTPYDAMQKESWPSTPLSDPRISKNRNILISTMEKNGFNVYVTEWWHFDFTGWEKFDVMDIDFEQLESKK